MPASSPSTRAHRRHSLALPTAGGVARLAGAALIYAVLHWAFTTLPLTLPVAGRWYLALRPGALVPIIVGLLAGPRPGLMAGVLGRLAGDMLAATGINGAGLIYSGLLGLIAGLGRPSAPADYATLRTQAWAALWALLAAVVAGLGAALAVETLLLEQLTLANGWDRAISEAMSGAVSVGLLLPSALYLAGRLRRAATQ